MQEIFLNHELYPSDKCFAEQIYVRILGNSVRIRNA